MGVVSGLIVGVLRIKWGNYTGFLQLDLISASFMGYMQVVCRYFMGILPFTAILQVIYHTPLLQEYRQLSPD